MVGHDERTQSLFQNLEPTSIFEALTVIQETNQPNVKYGSVELILNCDINSECNPALGELSSCKQAQLTLCFLILSPPPFSQCL